MYIFAVVSLIVIYIYGQASFGSARWLDTGVFFIQPSELVKIIMVIVLADYFARTHNEPHNLIWVAKSGALTFGVVLWILLQPNLSTSIVLVVLWFSLLWISGLPPKYIVFFGIGGFWRYRAISIFETTPDACIKFPVPRSNFTSNSYNVEQALISIDRGLFVWVWSWNPGSSYGI
jgi:rod shape determining protein RodA